MLYVCVTDQVIALSDGNKSLGLDGFNFSFFERFWPLLKEDIGVMLNRFHKFTSLLEVAPLSLLL